MKFHERLQEALGSAYGIERELPLGGLGRVFLATETATGRRVSVQALPPDLATRVDLGRFRAAVDRVSRLKHPGILPLIAAGARDDIVYCVWPHPRGESLRYRLVRDGGLGADDTVQVLHDVADALAYGHAQHVHHGDLKPDNIYIENGRAYVTEFGIRSALNAALGSEGGTGDARADVHALAVAGQQMVAGRSGPWEGAIARALSIDPREQFPDAAAFRDALGLAPSSMRRRRRVRLGIGLGLVALSVAAFVLNARRHPRLDPDLIAVAPFEVLGGEHDVWGEGLVTVLSANLDGAGPLRTVSPSIIVRRWRGPADAANAAALAQRTGARLALVGRVEPAGGDSMRLTAQLLDAGRGTRLGDMSVSDDRFDRLADSLAVRVLRAVSRSRPVSAVRTASLGTGSLAALKAFLVGEQHYRRSNWDSALANYQQAISLDSTFALALYRAGLVLGWLSNSSDSLSNAYLTRAAQHNRGLPPRDSMFVAAESLTATLEEDPDHPEYWRLYRRLYATTAELTRRYPRDPEAWYEFGDVRYHFPVFSTKQEMRDAFDRSIALDSAFAPAYIHPVELASQLGDVPAARRYITRYLALRPRDVFADAMRLTQLLLDPRQARGENVRRTLDTASNDLLMATVAPFHGWADSLETTVRIARLLDTRRGNAAGYAEDQLRIERAALLAYHGHFGEAVGIAPNVTYIVAAAAWLGVLPPDSAAAMYRQALARDPLYPRNLAAIGAPWLAQRRDTASLRDLAHRADSLQRGTRNPTERAFAAYLVDGTRALLLLAHGDTAGAIRGLAALPDTACARCALYPVQLAQLLDATGRDDALETLLAHESPGREYPTDALWALYRARLGVRRSDDRDVRTGYRFVRDAWWGGDAALQPYVQEAAAGLRRTRERD